MLIVLVLDATRRTVGWILPISAILFILYAYLGRLLDLVGLALFVLVIVVHSIRGARAHVRESGQRLPSA